VADWSKGFGGGRSGEAQGQPRCLPPGVRHDSFGGGERLRAIIQRTNRTLLSTHTKQEQRAAVARETWSLPIPPKPGEWYQAERRAVCRRFSLLETVTIPVFRSFPVVRYTVLSRSQSGISAVPAPCARSQSPIPPFNAPEDGRQTLMRRMRHLAQAYVPRHLCGTLPLREP